ncbi:MAG: alpha/beta fold hydrolase [Cyanobacteria bacterium J06598_1]
MSPATPTNGVPTNGVPTNILRRNPVVLVHGIWNTEQIFYPLKAYLEQAGWCVHTFSMTPNNGDAPIEVLAEQVAQFVERTFEGDRNHKQTFDLIGFSMGGLVSRYYLQRLGGLASVRKFVAISTPHYGTALALGSDRTGIRQMRPNSPFIIALNQDAYRLKDIQVSSLWTLFDLLILPPWSSKLQLGETRRLNVGSHNRMIRDLAGLEAIAQILKA